MSNIIDKIRLSGTDYTLSATSSGGSPTVELTQAEYDALVSAGTVSADTYYIITDAQAGDLTQYWTSAQTNSAITQAVSGKQDTLVSGTNIKTINNISILGSGNIDIQGGGGGGKAVSAGTNISITTGETADTINCTLNASNGNGVYSFKEGWATFANKRCAHAEGEQTLAGGAYSHAEGAYTTARADYSHTEGYNTNANNQYEHASGQYNVSNKANNTWGDSGNTLFSVGNGTADNARHNAFEIRQNGDIYISSGGTDIKLQDALGGGGGGGTVESAITSGSTNAVESKAIWSATTYNKDVLITFNGNTSTNYPAGFTKIKVEGITSNSSNTIIFNDDSGYQVGNITIMNWGSISVDNHFDGATYEIDGSTVIISYPTVTTVARLDIIDNTKYTYKAVVEGVWVNENTYMKQEVDGIASGLQTNINSKLDASAYTPTVVDSALNMASTNPVQNQALYSELRISNGGETETTLTFGSEYSTNYPSGCTKIKVEVVGSNNYSNINFFNANQILGTINIFYYGSISVENQFEGATYEISGTTVIISYPTVTNVTKIGTSGDGNHVYKAVTTEAPTVLKNQVVANTTALANKQDTLIAGTNITIVDNVISAQGGSITIDPSLDSGSTNPVANSAITTALNDKQIYNSSGYFYDVTTSYQNSGGKNTDYIRFKAYKNDGSTTNVTKLYFPRINGNKLVNLSAYYTDFQLLEKSAVTSAITSSSTDAQVPSAKAVYDIVGNIETLLSQI